MGKHSVRLSYKFKRAHLRVAAFDAAHLRVAAIDAVSISSRYVTAVTSNRVQTTYTLRSAEVLLSSSALFIFTLDDLLRRCCAWKVVWQCAEISRRVREAFWFFLLCFVCVSVRKRSCSIEGLILGSNLSV